MWSIVLDEESLVCDGCLVVFASIGPRETVSNAARARGWHLYEGPSLTSMEIVSHLCPACVQTPRSKLPPVTRLDGDEALF